MSTETTESSETQAPADPGGRLAEQAEEFWKKVNKKGKCWVFRGPPNPKGYGSFRYGSTGWRAHRLAWHLAKGPIPEGLLVCHTCDVRICCNPDHLFLGTVHDNNRDKAEKGRSNGGLVGVTLLMRQRKKLLADLAAIDLRITGHLERLTEAARMRDPSPD